MPSDSSAGCPDGVLVVDKPRGPTSHDVVSRMRRTLGVRAIGHGGTLDPMATGVLVLAVGRATKLAGWLTGQEKSYEATIALGCTTDTLDAEGREVKREPIRPELTEALESSNGSDVAPVLSAALERERARTMQVPPQFSAIRANGRRAFARARDGEEVALSPRRVVVHRLDLVGCSGRTPSLALSIVVSKGYYVRALARDLAGGLGTCGHLTHLRRTRSGPFTLDEAVGAGAAREEALRHLQPISTAAARIFRVARLTEAGVLDALHGRPVRASDIAADAPGPCAWLDERGAMIAIGEVDADGHGRVVRGFGRG